MAELVVADYTINSGRGQGYVPLFQMSREYCKIGKKCPSNRKYHLRVSLHAGRILQNMHNSSDSLQTAVSRAGTKGTASRCPLNAARFPPPTTDSPARGHVKTQAVRSLNATEGCPDEVKRLRKSVQREAGGGVFHSRWAAGGSVFLKHTAAFF